MIDASKVPPSRFQKREGSIYATPGSRDGHVEKNTRKAFAEKLKEKVNNDFLSFPPPLSLSFSIFLFFPPPLSLFPYFSLTPSLFQG